MLNTTSLDHESLPIYSRWTIITGIPRSVFRFNQQPTYGKMNRLYDLPHRAVQLAEVSCHGTVPTATVESNCALFNYIQHVNDPYAPLFFIFLELRVTIISWNDEVTNSIDFNKLEAQGAIVPVTLHSQLNELKRREFYPRSLEINQNAVFCQISRSKHSEQRNKKEINKRFGLIIFIILSLLTTLS